MTGCRLRLGVFRCLCQCIERARIELKRITHMLCSTYSYANRRLYSAQRRVANSHFPLHTAAMHAYASPHRLMLCHCLQQIEGVTRNFTLILLFCEDTVIKCFTIILTRFTLENISVLLCTQIHLLALTLAFSLSLAHLSSLAPRHGTSWLSFTFVFRNFFSASQIYFEFSFFSPPVTRQI